MSDEIISALDGKVFAKKRKHLNGAEMTVLRGSWEGKTYDELAENGQYSLAYLKQAAGPKLWKLLSEVLGVEVSKTTFRTVVEQWWQEQLGQTSPYQKHIESFFEATEKQPATTTDEEARFDLSEAPDISVFYGRGEELATLQQWVVPEKCRLVAIYGMARIGKTAFAVQLAKKIQGQFDYVIWRSLRNTPKPDALLDDLLKFLPKSDSKKFSPDFNAKLSHLIECFKDYRCLVILDQVEAILRPGTKLGRYVEGFENYGELFKRVGQVEHQSCLLVLTQEKIREINLLEGSELPIRSFHLKELKESEAKEILSAKGLSGKEKWGDLVKMYKGNPFILKSVAQTIQEVFNGNVAEFIEFKTLSGGSLFEILFNNLKRLSDLEKEVLACLAKEKKAISIQELQTKLASKKVSNSELISAIESLGGRSMIEKSTQKIQDKSITFFTPDPLLKAYLIKKDVAAK